MSQVTFSTTYFKDQFNYSTPEVKNFSNKVSISVDKLKGLSRNCTNDQLFLKEIVSIVGKKNNILDNNREDRGLIHSKFLFGLFSSDRLPYKDSLKESTLSYLDYGGGNGDIAKIIGNHIGIEDKKRILNVETGSLNFNKHITTLSTIPNDVKLGFVTAFHVIHHLGSKTKEVLTDIYDRMIPGSYFVIYEHALPTRERETTMKSLHLIHFMYECVFEGKSYDNFIKDSQETYFYTIDELKKLLVYTGFTHIAKKELNNRDKSYYAIFRK